MRSSSKYTACKCRKICKNRLKFHLKWAMAVILVGLVFGSKRLICTSLKVLCTYKVSCMYVEAKVGQSLLMSFRMIGKSVKT